MTVIILAIVVILSLANNRQVESAKEVHDVHNSSVILERVAILSTQWKTDDLLNQTTLSRKEYVKKGLSERGFTEEIDQIIVI